MPNKTKLEVSGILTSSVSLSLVAKSCLTLATSWTTAHQTPLSMGSSRQESWSRLPFPSPGDLPNPGIEPGSPPLQADSLPTELRGKPSVSLPPPIQNPTPPYRWRIVFKAQWQYHRGFPGGSVVENQPANSGDAGSIPGSGRSPGVENGNPLQYSCLENSTDGRAWQATVHGVSKESDMTEHELHIRIRETCVWIWALLTQSFLVYSMEVVVLPTSKDFCGERMRSCL